MVPIQQYSKDTRKSFVAWRLEAKRMAPVEAKHLKVGLYLPQGDGRMSPGIHSWADILRRARQAEEAGLDSVWIADHMIFRFENLPTEGRWECWTLLGALAATTSRVDIGPLVSCMGFRNPALLAKMAETVDEISGGRLVLGLGAGWHQPEFVSYGFPFDHRASRFEEGFEILYNLIRTGEVDFTGKFERAPNCELKPRGPRNGRIPIMLGTDGPRLLQLAAKHADIWNTTWTRSASELEPRIVALDNACLEAGRAPETIQRSACVHLDVEGARGVFSADGSASTPYPRDPAEAAEFFMSYAKMGVACLMIWLDPYSDEAIEQLGRAVDYLRA
jgi:alkanesulfonate monooxygenase SsuD/methylene tetrahydromethanopterin reductase-like flavin-dependent oxidoreductase (luciferase family)